MSEKKPLTEGYQPKKDYGYQPREPKPRKPEPRSGYVPETGQQQQTPIPPPKEE